MTLQIDPLGRVELPEALRESLRLHSGDHLNARLEDGRIVLEPMTAEGLIERDGMLIWTGGVEQSVDMVALSRAERDQHVLGS